MSDRIIVGCSNCDGSFSLPEAVAGKRIRCPKCQNVIAVPGAQASVAVEKRKTTGLASESTGLRSKRPPSQPRRRKTPERAEQTDESQQDADWPSQQEDGDPWSSYGPPDDSPRALPPRTRQRNEDRSARAVRGTGNEFPSSDEAVRETSGRSANGSVITGILMMIGAAVWFVGGLAADIIFFYPPVLFVLGIIAMVKGLMQSD